MNKTPNENGNGISGTGNLIGKDSDYPKLGDQEVLPHVVSKEKFDLVKDTISPRVQKVIESLDESEAQDLKLSESVDAITWHQTGLTREDIYWAMMVHEHVERLINAIAGFDYSKSALNRYNDKINQLLKRFRLLRDLINKSNPEEEGHGFRLWKGNEDVLQQIKDTYEQLGIKPSMDPRKDPMAATLRWSGEPRRPKGGEPDGDKTDSSTEDVKKECSFTLTGYQLAAYLTLAKSEESGGKQVSVKKITESIDQIRSLYFIYIDLALDRHLYLEQGDSGD